MQVSLREKEANVVTFNPVVASRTCITTLLLMFSGNALGESVDKSGFHLLNPTPKDAMRDFATDRPDKTESAYSVDAGHFQIEMDLVTFERDRDRNDGNDIVTESWAVAPINFKVGLCNRVDFQVIVESYNRVTTVDRLANSRMRQSGYGDTTARLKVNAWGNDGGTTALALMPYVKFPSNQNNLGNSAYEGGLIIPASIDIGHGFGLGLMTQFDVMQNSLDSDYHAEFVNSMTIGHDIIGDLAGYVEFWTLTSAESGANWQATIDLGLTYGLTDNIQIDGGVNIGVTRSAPDIQPFLGLSMRY